jgi:RND family efflux transporter MFP subunit
LARISANRCRKNRRLSCFVLRQQKAYQQVVAPFDGIVTRRNIDVGTLVQADTASGAFMFALSHSSVLRIQLFVPQDAAIGVKPRIDAVVRVPEVPGRSFPSKVTRIAVALDPSTRTLLTEIDLPNTSGELRPGMYCTVELKVPRKMASMIVPAGAIVFDAAGQHVLVVENGTVHSRMITEVRGSPATTPRAMLADELRGRACSPAYCLMATATA